MIISASRRTDIPAFYSEWFMKRVRAGYFYRVNPFNSKQVAAFSLQPEDVDAICFWTKDPQPLMRHLSELSQRGLRYYFQFTLNPYGKEFEPGVPSRQARIAACLQLAALLGPERVVWRYDPVILSNVTPVTWHLEQAEKLAGLLHGATRRLVFSFCDFYGRGNGRLASALQGHGIVLTDIAAPAQADKRYALVRGLKAIADRNNLQIFSCSEAEDLSSFGIEHGACIDARLINDLFGGKPSSTRDKNQRRACGCVESVDMGSYNSCHFRCRYCYANFNEGLIAGNCLRHCLDSPALLGRHDCKIELRSALSRGRKSAGSQPLLFRPEEM